jgi:peroxiredoxin Q/BCP
LPELEAAGATIVAVTVDGPDKISQVKEKLGLDFQVLSDPDARLIRAMGVFHEEFAIARPATFLISDDGHIVWRSLTENYRIRPRVSDLLAALSSAEWAESPSS